MKRKTTAIHNRSPVRIEDLIRLLDVLAKLHEEWLGVIDRKITAMKRSDLEAMRACQENEQSLIMRMSEREGLRAQLMDRLGETLSTPPGSGRSLTISELAERLVESERPALITGAERLRHRIAEVAQANRVAGAIARGIVDHMRWVFAAVRPQDDGPVEYSPRGVPVERSQAYWFEAVG